MYKTEPCTEPCHYFQEFFGQFVGKYIFALNQDNDIKQVFSPLLPSVQPETVKASKL